MIIEKTIKNILIDLRKERIQKGYSQQFMASKLGMSQNGYSKVELGYSTLTVSFLIQAADILNVNLGLMIESASSINSY